MKLIEAFRDAMFTRTPRLAFRWGHAARVRKKHQVDFLRRLRSHSSSDMFFQPMEAGHGSVIWKSTSIRPKAWTAKSTRSLAGRLSCSDRTAAARPYRSPRCAKRPLRSRWLLRRRRGGHSRRPERPPGRTFSALARPILPPVPVMNADLSCEACST